MNKKDQTKIDLLWEIIKELNPDREEYAIVVKFLAKLIIFYKKQK